MKKQNVNFIWGLYFHYHQQTPFTHKKTTNFTDMKLIEFQLKQIHSFIKSLWNFTSAAAANSFLSVKFFVCL